MSCVVGCVRLCVQVSGTVSCTSCGMYKQPPYNYFVSRKPHETFAGPKKHIIIIIIIIIILYEVHLQRNSLQEVRSVGDAVRKTYELCVSKLLLLSSSLFFCPSVYITHFAPNWTDFHKILYYGCLL